jgi:hypothetical protein
MIAFSVFKSSAIANAIPALQEVSDYSIRERIWE